MEHKSFINGNQMLLFSSSSNAHVPFAPDRASGSKNKKSNEENYDNEVVIRDHDLYMPIANVTRIMRKFLPTHAKISDDTKELVQECVSEFIGFVTSEANERCKHEKRRTIMADDILWAMHRLGLDDYVEPLSLYLRLYRESEGERALPPVYRHYDQSPLTIPSNPPHYDQSPLTIPSNPPFQNPPGMLSLQLNGLFNDGQSVGPNGKAPMGILGPSTPYQ